MPAAEAFGDYDPDFVQEWSHKVFPPGMELKPGQKVLPANLPFPPEYPLTVKEVTADCVILDMNHPFAGHDLRYQVKVVEVRPATPEELEPLKAVPVLRRGDELRALMVSRQDAKAQKKGRGTRVPPPLSALQPPGALRFPLS